MENVSDKFPGITIDEYRDQSHSFEFNGEIIKIHQKLISVNKYEKLIEITFDLKAPTRFKIVFPVPDNVVNACVTLNNSPMIDFFSDYFPEEFIPPFDECCSGGEGNIKFSTLIPGEKQSVNFKWYKDDILRIHLYYPKTIQ